MRYLVSLIVVCIACYVPVTTGATDSRNSVRVTFEELDLKKEARVTELYARLKRAAEKVCEGSDFSYASGRREQRTCYQDTLQTAVS